MTDSWYCATDGKPTGPVSLQQLMAELHARPDWQHELVWRPGAIDWTEAGTIAELRNVPPPLPDKSSPRPKDPAPPDAPKPRARIVGWLISAVTLVVVLIAASFGGVIARSYAA
jgi:hypothetical protein